MTNIDQTHGSLNNGQSQLQQCQDLSVVALAVVLQKRVGTWEAQREEEKVFFHKSKS